MAGMRETWAVPPATITAAVKRSEKFCYLPPRKARAAQEEE